MSMSYLIFHILVLPQLAIFVMFQRRAIVPTENEIYLSAALSFCYSLRTLFKFLKREKGKSYSWLEL